jgi:hypothetical protein
MHPYVTELHQSMGRVKFKPVVPVFTKHEPIQWSKECILIEGRNTAGAVSEIYSRYPGCVFPSIKFADSALDLALTRYLRRDEHMGSRIESVGKHYCAADPSYTEITVTRISAYHPTTNQAAVLERRLLGTIRCGGRG